MRSRRAAATSTATPSESRRPTRSALTIVLDRRTCAVSHAIAKLAASPITIEAPRIFSERERDAAAFEPAEPAAEQPEQHARVEDRGDRGSERQAAITHHAYEREIEREVRDHGDAR